MSSKLDWLTKEEEEFEPTFKLPEGGSFTGEKVGEWHLGALYRIMVTKDIDLESLKITYDGRQEFPNGNYVNYYWLPDNRAQADDAAKQTGGKYGAQFMWHWMMKTNTFLNYRGKDKSVTEQFGEKIEFDIPLVGWGSDKHPLFQLIMLPSLVQALASKQGLIEKPIYDYKNLPPYRKEDAVEITPELQEHYLNADTGMLVKARQELWAVLGEENPKTYTIDTGTKFSIVSKNLRRLVSVVYRPNVELWLKVAEVFDPRVSAKTNDGKQLRAYITTGFYWDEAEAKKEAGVEDVDDGLPPLPEIWRSFKKSDFVNQMKDFLTENKFVGAHPKMKGKSLISLDIPTISKQLESLDLEPMGATLEEILPWLEHVIPVPY